MSIVDKLSYDILYYIMTYIDYDTLLSIYILSSNFLKFYEQNIDYILREMLFRSTKLITKTYNRSQLIRLTKIPFENKNISAGNGHSLIISNNQVYAFGYNEYGQLGLSDNINRNLPVVISYFTNQQIKIIDTSCGESHSLSLSNIGQIYSFGLNSYGELGLPIDNTKLNVPSLVDQLTNIIQISCGGYHSLTLNDSNSIYSFGRNDYGQLGLNHNNHNDKPTKIENFTNIIQIMAGCYHSLFLTDMGQVYVFGQNFNGQLGLGDDNYRNVPTLIETLLNNIVKISTKSFHSLILNNNGEIYAFGANYANQLGMQDFNNKYLPVQSPEHNNIIDISCGENHSLILTNTKQLYTFGNREVLYPKNKITNVKQIAAGVGHSLILKDNNQIYSFGYNYYGQLGLGDNINQNVPLLIININ